MSWIDGGRLLVSTQCLCSSSVLGDVTECRGGLYLAVSIAGFLSSAVLESEVAYEGCVCASYSKDGLLAYFDGFYVMERTDESSEIGGIERCWEGESRD